MTITALPTAPSRSDTAAVFVAAADAFVAALPTLVTEVNAATLAMNLNATSDTSASSVLIGTGAKSFTVTAGKSFLGGMFLVIADTAAPSTNWMSGQVTSYSGTSLVMNILAVGGSGTKSAWIISQSATGVAGGAVVAGLGANTFTGLQTFAAGASIASAATIDFTAATGNTVHITGTTPISAVTMNDGQWVKAIFDGACPLTYHATTHKLNTAGSSPTLAAGDAVFYMRSGSVVYGQIVKADGSAVNARSKIQSISASVGASALTITADAMTLDFRSATLGSGTISTVSGDPADLVIPSGAKMGAVSGQQSRIAVLALNNSGTIELAATNVGGAGTAKDLSETGLISTEATTVGCTFTGAIAVTTGILTLTTGLTGSLTIGQQLTGTNVTSGTVVLSLLSGSLGANGSTYQTNQFTAAASTTITGAPGVGVYSTTARSNLAYRVLGYVESTQATAGTWATAPSTIQGSGGNAVSAMSSLGYGQTWQDMTASRALSTTYYNTTGRPIGLSIYSATAAAEGLILAINGVTVADNYASASSAIAQITSIVPPGANYSLAVHSGTFAKWSELR